VNTTLTVHAVFVANVVPQLGAPVGNVPAVLRENGAVTAMEMPLSWAPPLLDNVRFCDALVVPTPTLPNASDAGVTAGIAPLPPCTPPLRYPLDLKSSWPCCCRRNRRSVQERCRRHSWRLRAADPNVIEYAPSAGPTGAAASIS